MSNQYNLWLDDVRYPPRQTATTYRWLWATSCQECIKIIEENGRPYALSLDFDLDEFDDNYEYDGLDVLRWIHENDMWPTNYISVHSANVVGTMRMHSFIEDFAPEEVTILDYRALYEKNGRLDDDNYYN